jgi:alkylhydroperoxidase family enzyme
MQTETVMPRDPFPRRTATLPALVPWIAELGRTLPGLVRSYRGGVDPRARERVILAVTEVNGCRYCAWIHGSWQDYLGDRGLADAEDALVAYARACADAGVPVDPAPLRDHLPPQAVEAVRATVAQIEVSNLVGNTVDGLLARATRMRPFDPINAARELAVVGAAVPIALPLLTLAGAMRAVHRLAPPVPEVEMPPAGEANLLVHLLAEATPTLLANALVRLLVLRAPIRLTLALRAGRTTATIRLRNGHVALENGVASDANAVVEGDVGPLLRLASGSLFAELTRLRLRPNS